MLDHLINHLQPRQAKNLLNIIHDVSNLSMEPGGSSIKFMTKVQSIWGRLVTDIFPRLMPSFVIVNLDQDRYPGLISHYTERIAAIFKYVLWVLHER